MIVLSSRNIFVILLFLLFCIVYFPSQIVADSPFGVVKRYIENLNQNNWTEISKLWVKEHQIDFFDIKKAQLVRWKEVPYQYVRNFVPVSYMEKFQSPKAFYVAVDIKVDQETKHYINGINYFFIVVVREEGEWKIAIIPKPPIDSVIADGYGFGTNDEKTFDERRLKES